MKIDDYLDNIQKAKVLKNQESNKGVYCRYCKSDNVQPFKKGFGLGKAALGGLIAGPFGLLAGCIGSGKVKVYCLKCGQTGYPRIIK